MKGLHFCLVFLSFVLLFSSNLVNADTPSAFKSERSFSSFFLSWQQGSFLRDSHEPPSSETESSAEETTTPTNTTDVVTGHETTEETEHETTEETGHETSEETEHETSEETEHETSEETEHETEGETEHETGEETEHETGEETEHETEEEEEEEVDETVESTSVLFILTILILLSILFELFQEKIEESVDDEIRPIIESFWQELTVLGFLSLLTFVLVKSGSLEGLSEDLFGEEEGELLSEHVETIHMLLFFTMVAFIVEVLGLTWLASREEKIWRGFEEDVYRPKVIEEEYQLAQEQGSIFNRQLGKAKEKFEYLQLRELFINPSHLDFPSLDPKFDFAEYLAILLGKTMAGMVHISLATWLVLEISFIVFWAFLFAGEEAELILFVIFVYLQHIFLHLILNKLRYIKSQLLPPHHASLSSINQSDLETPGRPLLSATEKPRPPYLDLKIRARGSKFEEKLFGRPANEHELLFWFDRHGETFILESCQTLLLLTAIDVSLLLAYFGPYCADNYNTLRTTIIIIVIILPIIGNCLVSPQVISLLVVVSNVEKKRKKEVIAQVIRVDKTKRSVRILRVLNLLQTLLHRADKQKAKQEGKTPVVVDSIPQEKKEKLKEMFDLFDKDHSGAISVDEFRHLLEVAGQPVTHEEARLKVQEIDIDGNGELSFDEFLVYMAHHIADDEGHVNPEELAESIFAIYDKDGNGVLTATEFKDMLTSIGEAVTVDDVQHMMREMDRDDSGQINAEEFGALLRKYL